MTCPECGGCLVCAANKPVRRAPQRAAYERDHAYVGLTESEMITLDGVMQMSAERAMRESVDFSEAQLALDQAMAWATDHDYAVEIWGGNKLELTLGHASVRCWPSEVKEAARVLEIFFEASADFGRD